MERKKHGKTTICLRTVGIFDLWTVNHFYSQMYVPYLLNCSLRNSVTAEVFSCSSLTSSKSESAVSQLVHTLFFICLVTTFFLKTQVTSRKCINCGNGLAFGRVMNDYVVKIVSNFTVTVLHSYFIIHYFQWEGKFFFFKYHSFTKEITGKYSF